MTKRRGGNVGLRLAAALLALCAGAGAVVVALLLLRETIG
jgi:hypothetical protein